MASARSILLGTPGRRAATLILFALIFCAVAVEIACQAVAWWQFRGLEVARGDPSHYYQPSADPTLVYELKRNVTLEKNGKRLHINALGFREDTDSTFADKRRVAIMGDSVAFGIGVVQLSQDETIPAVLQRLIDPDISKTKVLNCGLPGLGLGEFPAYLHIIQQTYKPDAVIYLLNPNDFVLRDTVYEGADNGLYRTYRHPWLKTPLVIRKAIYRMKKGGVYPTTAWYRWTFDGTKDRDFPRFNELKALCDGAHADFRVVFLPVRASFDPADKTIPDIYREIGAYLTSAGIAWIDPTPDFAKAGGANGLIDETDHLTAEGSRVMAGALRAAAASSR